MSKLNHFGNVELSDRRLSSMGLEVTGNGEYFIENGRTYNNISWAYRFPADQEEVVRLDRQHYVMLLSLPGLYRGPVDEILGDTQRVRRVLDIGCGTGIWLAEMAERFPNTDCVGIDLMPLQHSHQLHNCTYMCVEAPHGMRVFPNNAFDVVHVQQMMYSVTNFAGVVHQAYRMLRQGGILLIHEPNLLLYSGQEGYTPEELAPGITKWMYHFRLALLHRKIDMCSFNQMEDFLSDAGFDREGIDAYFHYRQVCPCELQTDIGVHETENTHAIVSASRLLILEAGHLNAEEYDALEQEVYNELHGRSSGSVGGFGGQRVFAPWGYWWVRK